MAPQNTGRRHRRFHHARDSGAIAKLRDLLPADAYAKFDLVWFDPSKEKRDRLLEQASELVGSVARLEFLEEDLESVRGADNLEAALARLEYYVEHYYTLGYAFLERVRRVLETVAGMPNREAISQSGEKLLRMLEEDSRVRNILTHEQLPQLCFFVGDWADGRIGDWVGNAADALLDLKRTPAVHAKLERVVRGALSRFIRSYTEKLEALQRQVDEFSDALFDYADAADPSTAAR